MNIQQFRQQYPQYNNVGNQELADKLYNKYYAGKIDRSMFDSKFLGTVKNNTVPQKKSPSAWDLLTNPDEQWKMARDFVGSGIVNPLINFVNLGPEAERAVASKYGLPQLPNIPNMKTDPHSWSSHAGDFASYFAPILGMERGLAKVAEVAPEFIGKSLGLFAASSGASAAISPEGQRVNNAELGAAGGTAGHYLSKLISSIAHNVGAAIPKETVKEAPRVLTDDFQAWNG